MPEPSIVYQLRGGDPKLTMTKAQLNNLILQARNRGYRVLIFISLLALFLGTLKMPQAVRRSANQPPRSNYAQRQLSVTVDNGFVRPEIFSTAL
jgi:hypothetical protein